MKHICISNYTEHDIYVLHDLYKAANPTYSTDCYEIVYLAHGTGFYEKKDTQIRATEGDIFLTCPKSAHNLIPDPNLRGLEIYYCYFTDKAIATFKPNLTEAFTSFTDLSKHKTTFLSAADLPNKEIRDIMVRMIDEQLSTLPCRYNIIEGYLPILLTKILRTLQACQTERVYSHNMTVDIAIRYIHSKLYSKVSLNDIAEHLRVSPSYVCRIFRKHVGMTPVQYINFLRVEKMKDILKNTDRPVTRITEMFIMDGSYLRQIFKRQTGMTIQEYHDKYNYKHHPA